MDDTKKMITFKVKDNVDILTIYKKILIDEDLPDKEVIIVDMYNFDSSMDCELNILEKFKEIAKLKNINVKFLNFNGTLKKVLHHKRRKNG